MNESLQPLVLALLTPIAFGLAVWVAWILRYQIRAIIDATGLTELEINKEGGVKAKFDAKKFTTATYNKQGLGIPPSEDMKEVATLVQSFSSLVAGRRILWVDNYPENNRLERTALVSWGIDVQTRRTTEEAMIELGNKNDIPFDLVISDWYRNGQEEGQRLAEMMHAEKVAVPILFYFRVEKKNLFNKIQEKASTLKAVGATSSPRELLRWIFAELIYSSLRDKQTSFVSN
jgi:CheY-like chemotaxis protein